MATTPQSVGSPIGAFLRGFQGAQARQQQAQQQEVNNALTEQLRQVQLLTAQRQLAEASKTPQQRLSEQIQEAFAVDALKRGALVQTPVGLEGESIALPSAIGQTAAQLGDSNAFSSALPQAPLSITAGQPQLPSLSDALSNIVIPQAQQTPSFNIPSAPMRGFEVPTAIPGFNVSEEAARQKMAQDISKATQLAKAKFEATPAGYQIFTDALGNVSYIPKTPGRGEVQAITNPETGEQLKGKVPTTASGNLTVFQQNSELAKATKAGVDPEQFRDPTTQKIDFQGLAIERGRAEGEAVNAANVIKNARLAATAAKGSKPTASQENFQLYGNRMQQADDTLKNLSDKGFDPTSVGVEGLAGQWLPNLLKSSDRQSYEQAQRNFINAVLRKESGAVISDAEFENARKQYFPQPGDSSDILSQKTETRKLVIDEFKRLGGSPSSKTTVSETISTPATTALRGTISATPPAVVTAKSGNTFQLAQ